MRRFMAIEVSGLADMWAAYRDTYDAVIDTTVAAARALPQFGAVLARLTAEDLSQQQAHSRAILEGAMLRGEWEPYVEDLKTQGLVYAQLGVDYAEWFELTAVFGTALTEELLRRHVGDPARLQAGLLALNAFSNAAMAVVAEAYASARERVISDREREVAVILRSITIGVVATDEGGRVTRMNPAAARLVGWTADEAQGRLVSEVLLLGDADLEGWVEAAAGGESAGRRQLRITSREGKEREVELEVSALNHDLPAQRAGAILTLRDLSAQREAEKVKSALARSEKKLHHLMDAGVIGIIVADLRGNILEANDAFLQLVGYSREDLEGGLVRWSEMTPREYDEVDQKAIELLTSVGVAPSWEKEYFCKDGSRVPIVLGVAMLDDDTCIAFVLDNSTRVRSEALRLHAARLEAESVQARHASRLKSEFLANMSHELRTPLNAIIGFAELLHLGEVGPLEDKQVEFIGDILTSGRHLLQLINDVLDLSKVEAGKMEFRPELVKPELLVAEVTGVLRTVAASRRVRVAVDVEPSLGPLQIDPSRFKQVLYNYLSNALKFTKEDTTVEIRVKAEDTERFRLEVADHGAGIPAAEIGKLFTEFQQLEGGAAKKHAGTGLGLALTRRLVEAQEGSVGVSSEVGAGSVFYAVLPRRSRARAGTPISASPAAQGQPGAPRILVVEDDLEEQARIVSILADAGYTVDSASTVSHALAACREHVYDAITLDLILPDGSGVDLLHRIRRETANAGVRVVVITVVAEPGAVAGVPIQELLPKPLDSDRLKAALARVGLSPQGPGHVLVVDDDPKARKLMEAVLGQAGYSVLTCGDAELALAALDEVTPAAIVLDLVMPGIDGFEFLDRLRAMPTGRTLPVIVWSVKELGAEEQERLRRSAQAIVTKGRGGQAIVEQLRVFTHPSRGARA